MAEINLPVSVSLGYDFGSNEIKWTDVGCGSITNIKFTEEKEEMNFELGDILVAKDEVADFMDGEAILIAPGYSQEDFDVNKTDKGVQVTAYRDCEDCGDIETKEFAFDFNPYRKVEDVKYNVRDGIFILQVAYAVGSNVEVDENL